MILWVVDEISKKATNEYIIASLIKTKFQF